MDPSKLHAALDAVRQEKGSSWRALAGDIGVSPSLLSRIANGQKPDADGFATIVRWLGLPAEQFFSDDGAPAKQPELTAQLAPLLRARGDLSEKDIDYIETVVRATLERVRAGE